MLRNQKCFSWSVCEISLQSQEFNSSRWCFPEGSVDGGSRNKCRSGLFLPSSSKHELGETSPCWPCFGALCTVPLKLLFHGCCSSCLLVTFNEPLFSSQEMTAPTWIMIPVGDTLYHHWHGSWIEKKRDFSRAELSLNIEHSVWGCPNLGHSGWNALSSSLATAAVQVLWNVWYLGGSFRSRRNSTANLTETSVYLSDSENPAASKTQELSVGLLWSDFLHFSMSCPCLALLFFPELIILSDQWPHGWCCFV